MMLLRICRFLAVAGLLAIVAVVGCEKEYPDKDQVPVIRDLIGKLQREVEAKNAAAIDSMIIASAYDEGYSSTSILEDVYPEGDTAFYAFANKEIVYKHDKGEVTFDIITSPEDTLGRPAEMTIVKIDDDWYIKRFDVK